MTTADCDDIFDSVVSRHPAPVLACARRDSWCHPTQVEKIMAKDKLATKAAKTSSKADEVAICYVKGPLVRATMISHSTLHRR